MRKLVTYEAAHEAPTSKLMLGDVVATAVGKRSVEAIHADGSVTCDYPRKPRDAQLFTFGDTVRIVGRVESYPPKAPAKPRKVSAKKQALVSEAPPKRQPKAAEQAKVVRGNTKRTPKADSPNNAANVAKLLETVAQALESNVIALRAAAVVLSEAS